MSLVENYIHEYLENLQPFCEGELGQLQKTSYEKEVPIIPKDVVQFLGVVLSIVKPKKILEIGMAVGFSASYMTGFLQEGGHLTTIDRFDVMIKQAKENFKRLGVEDKVTILEGNANDILPTLDEQYDFIFMDAAKGQYIQILPDVLRLLKKGGVIIADDILQEGRVAQAYEEVPKRQRTIHKRMNEFLNEITNNPKLKSSILTIGDGVAFIQKIEDWWNEKNRITCSSWRFGKT